MSYVPTMHVVGGGPMGLWSAWLLRRFSMTEGRDIAVSLYDRQPGGAPDDPLAAGTRCQGWLHSAIMYVLHQPDVALAVAHAARIWRENFGDAIQKFVPAFYLVPREQATAVTSGARALDIKATEVPQETVRGIARSLCKVDLDRFAILRTADAPLNYGALIRSILAKIARDVCHVPHHVVAVERRGNAITGLLLDSGHRIAVRARDVVVLAASASIPALLDPIDVPHQIRVFASQLVAIRHDQRALLMVGNGGATACPHILRDGTSVVLLGDANRRSAGEALKPSDSVRDVVLERARMELGLEGPLVGTWLGCKAEVTNGVRNLGHAVWRADGLDQLVIGLPGKLTASPVAANDLARLVLNQNTRDGSYWDR